VRGCVESRYGIRVGCKYLDVVSGVSPAISGCLEELAAKLLGTPGMLVIRHKKRAVNPPFCQPSRVTVID